jgi:hypothetical protein
MLPLWHLKFWGRLLDFWEIDVWLLANAIGVTRLQDLCGVQTITFELEATLFNESWMGSSKCHAFSCYMDILQYL